MSVAEFSSAEMPIKNIIPQYKTVYPFNEQLKYGSTIYPLNKPLEIYCFQENCNFVSMVSDTRFPFIGKAETDDNAIQNWILNFHKSFQKLSALGDFEMTSEQLETWNCFQEIIDFAKYDKLNPLHYHLKGRITNFENEHKVRIDWLGGRFSLLEYDKTPADFVLYDIDQWFEAVIERDFETGNALKILDVRPIENPYLSQQQEQELWELANK